jgi:hypothetical protein
MSLAVYGRADAGDGCRLSSRAAMVSNEGFSRGHYPGAYPVSQTSAIGWNIHFKESRPMAGRQPMRHQVSENGR